MQTSLDCLLCFVRQARSTGKLATEDGKIQRTLIDLAGEYLATVDTALSPPENAVGLYAAMAEVLDTDDPFARVKKQSNDFALSIKGTMKARIQAAKDPLRAALRVAIGGNIIDYAAQHVFDINKTMETCLTLPFVLDDYAGLLAKLHGKTSPKLLYLCDNCGEIVFDGLFIGELQQLGCQVTAAVRKFPIINDATMADAEYTGLDAICPVITNGTSCPGTPLFSCSDEFKRFFAGADIIISKGMGNFETLSETEAPVFFLFTVKCAEVARHVTALKGLAPGSLTGKGEMILIEQDCEIL
jgi:uncharacterized protein with ATP-grasp and redox domains